MADESKKPEHGNLPAGGSGPGQHPSNPIAGEPGGSAGGPPTWPGTGPGPRPSRRGDDDPSAAEEVPTVAVQYSLRRDMYMLPADYQQARKAWLSVATFGVAENVAGDMAPTENGKGKRRVYQEGEVPIEQGDQVPMPATDALIDDYRFYKQSVTKREEGRNK